MAASYSHYGYYPHASEPIAVPHKGNDSFYPQYPHIHYPELSESPPDVDDATSSGGPSYDPTGTSASYAASTSDYEGSTGVSSVDLLEYMSDRLQSTYNPLPIDKNLVKQAQKWVWFLIHKPKLTTYRSGEMNAKQRQLKELQALAQQRFAAMQANFADGIKSAKEVKRDLEWTQKKVKWVEVSQMWHFWHLQFSEQASSQKVPQWVLCCPTNVSCSWGFLVYGYCGLFPVWAISHFLHDFSLINERKFHFEIHCCNIKIKNVEATSCIPLYFPSILFRTQKQRAVPLS
jgi:biogenesis of lysosome-related organelles complex 1 subunit KXD1